jgi:peptide/nickel transport system ATP-binding protein
VSVARLLDVENLGTVVGAGAQAPSILDEVSLSIDEGEVVGVVGESGSGKSMLALTVMGLLPWPVRRISGVIRLQGEELTALPPAVWRQRRGTVMAMIFQEPMAALNPLMRVEQQIGEVLRKRKGLSGRAARKRALELLRRVEIPAAERRLDDYPHQLSGGMRQRVMIAMALAAEPRLLVADEPTTALDVTIQAQILELLRELQREYRMGVMLITHDLGVIAELADRVVVLYAGRVAETAPVRTLFDEPLHPYTKGLLDSIPRLDTARDKLRSIDGSVPAVGAMPPGCRFAPRCPLFRDACNVAPPPLLPVRDGHEVACIAYEAGR